MPAASQTPLGKLLAARIRERGPITFADYMAECLYHPEHGYYSRAESQRFADYYTSVDVHPIFGRLLARQFAEMWERCGRPVEFSVVEAGAGVGRLAAHVLDFAARVLPEFYAALRYVAV
ncbi:MAG: SAM-dependent methyltransferase, partial [Acidobacteriales bacterium]|nr:SAM-dependent methyltransferase [Terriglobales bacterium]